MYRSMFSFKSATASLFTIPEAVSVLTIGVLVLVFHWYMRDSNYEALATRLPSWLFVLIVSAMLALIILIPGDKKCIRLLPILTTGYRTFAGEHDGSLLYLSYLLWSCVGTSRRTNPADT